MPEFKARDVARLAEKERELAPFVAAALARKPRDEADCAKATFRSSRRSAATSPVPQFSLTERATLPHPRSIRMQKPRDKLSESGSNDKSGR